MVQVVGEQNSIAHQFLAELRDTQIQQDRQRFRGNLEKLGSIMAYEISKKLTYTTQRIKTPLAQLTVPTLVHYPVLITILRAGLPYLDGFIKYFDKSDTGFIGAYRRENDEKVTVHLEYLATPGIDGKEVLLIDPMLATGRSVVEAISVLLRQGKPTHLHLVSLIAAPEGIQYIRDHVNLPYTLWTFMVDEKLNQKFYIVPGLGDAGDLSYGPKL